MSPANRIWVLALAATFLAACSHFTLSEHWPALSIQKQRRATDAMCVVEPFTFNPAVPNDNDPMSRADLDRWQQMLADGLNQANICGMVIKGEGGPLPQNAAYAIDGKITRYYFGKNWIPTFFPFHIGLSFFTLSIYTWAAGPTTVTKVRFEVEANLKDVQSGRVIRAFRESYEDTSPLNIYSSSSDVNNPYENPNIVFSQVINRLAVDVATAIP